MASEKSRKSNDFKETFELLRHEVSVLHMHWKMFRQLFGSGEDRIHLLNETAPAAFGIFQTTLLHEISLGVCRLTDPKNTGQYCNCSIAYILEIAECEKAKRDEWKTLLSELQIRTSDLREIRNKHLAHSDLDYKVRDTDIVFPSRAIFEEILAGIRNVANDIEHYFFDSTTAHDMFYFPLGTDGDHLIRRLSEIPEEP